MNPSLPTPPCVLAWRKRCFFVSTHTGHTCKPKCGLVLVDGKTNVWGCPLSGAYHLCGDECHSGTPTHEGSVCTLTGTELGVSMVYDQHSGFSGKPSAENAGFYVGAAATEDRQAGQINATVWKILDSTERKRLDVAVHQRNVAHAEAHVSRCYKTADPSAAPLCIGTLAELYMEKMQERRMVRAPDISSEEAQARVRRLQHKVLSIWKWMRRLPVSPRQPQRIGVVNFTTGIMYIIARGLEVNQRVLIEREPWLQDCLPAISDLTALGLCKGAVTLIRRWVQSKLAMVDAGGSNKLLITRF